MIDIPDHPGSRLWILALLLAFIGCSPTGQWDWGVNDWKLGGKEDRKRSFEERQRALTPPPPKETSYTKESDGFNFNFFKPDKKLFESPKNWFKKSGHRWTILCMELPGRGRQQEAETIAQALQSTAGIRPDDVFIKNDDDGSHVYYGSYIRREVDASGRLDVPPKMANDVALIKDLAGPRGGRFFYESRIVPYPTPDVGHPQWELSNNPGVHTLRIAIFYNEGKMTDRKKYAAEYVEELRNRGHEAYYRHGEITSEVYVGSFGEDAQIKGRKSGVAVYLPSPEVRAMQRKENFMYELWNMKVFSATSEQSRGRARRASKVVRVNEALGNLDPLADY